MPRPRKNSNVDVIDLAEENSGPEAMDLTGDTDEETLGSEAMEGIEKWGPESEEEEEDEEDGEGDEEEYEDDGGNKGTFSERKAARRQAMEEELQKAKAKEQRQYLDGLRKALAERENKVFEFEEVTYDPATLKSNLERLHAPADVTLSEFLFNRPPIPPLGDDEPLQLNLNQVNKELTCPVCLSIVSDTRTVRECLHRFCAGCINTSLRLGKKECPTCRANCNSQRHLGQDARFDMIIQRLNPDVEAYEATQEEAIKQINTSFNTTALRRSIEEGMRRQADSAKRAPRPARPATTPSQNQKQSSQQEQKRQGNKRSRSKESASPQPKRKRGRPRLRPESPPQTVPQGTSASHFSVPLFQEGKGTFRSVGGGSKFYVYNHIPQSLTSRRGTATPPKWSLSTVEDKGTLVTVAHKSGMSLAEIERVSTALLKME